MRLRWRDRADSKDGATSSAGKNAENRGESFGWLEEYFKSRVDGEHMNRRALAIVFYGVIMLIAVGLSFAMREPSTAQDARKAVDALNQEIVRACQQRDFDATAALWAEDGVDLLPGLTPMVGKTKITAWLDSLRPNLKGAKMAYCTIDWQDIQIHSDIAYEWGINRQLIEYPPPRKSTPTEGKIVFILRRQAYGAWKVVLESWNGNPQPQAD